MRLRAGLALLALAGCSGSSAESSEPTPSPEPAPPEASTPAADAGPTLEDVRLAAFAKVVEETAPLRHECWARGAADNYRLAGRVVVKVTLGEGGAPTRAEIDSDTTGDRVLTDCLVAGYRSHRWPAVFEAGTAVKVPFAFDAPSAQYTVSVDHVAPVSAAGKGLTIKPLLTSANTGNRAFALLEVSHREGRDLPLRRHAESSTVLYVTAGAGRVIDGRGAKRGTALAPGQAVYVPQGQVYGLEVDDTLSYLQLFAPAGPHVALLGGGGATGELTAAQRRKRPRGRREVVDVTSLPRLPSLGGKASVAIAFDAVGVKDTNAYLGHMLMEGGVTVPVHGHAKETEILLVTRGGGVMTVAGRAFPVQAPVAIQVPPGVEHGFVAAEGGFEALQFYTPSGPEQRFRGASKP